MTLQDAEPLEDVTGIVDEDEDAVDERPAGWLVGRDVPWRTCCCSALNSQRIMQMMKLDHWLRMQARKSPEALTQASLTRSRRCALPADHVGHPPLSLSGLSGTAC